MSGPIWLSAALAVVMLLIAAGSSVRLAIWRAGRGTVEPEVDALHVLMGMAMAGMLEPAISPVPDEAWRAVFAAAAAWFAWRAFRGRLLEHQTAAKGPLADRWRCAHPAPHVVECGAMIYMLLPVGFRGHGSAMTMPGMAGASAANPAISLVLALFMIGYIVWTADRLASQHRSRDTKASADAVTLAPGSAAVSKIAMSLAMGYMLLTML